MEHYRMVITKVENGYTIDLGNELATAYVFATAKEVCDFVLAYFPETLGG